MPKLPPEGSPAHRQERAEVDAILASEMFKRAPNICRILAYISNQYFAGEASKIKEYNIGMEALGRGADFDPSRDTIVRVEASRLRKRLKEYYLGEGADHELHLVLARAGYVPQFVPSSAVEQEVESLDWEGEGTSGIPESAPLWRRLRLGLAAHTRLLAACGVVLVLVLAAGLWEVRSHNAPATAPDQPEATNRVPVSKGPLEVPPDGVRILAGHLRPEHVDGLGRLWLGDRYFSGGSVTASEGSVILGVLDPTLYCTARQGDFRYDIPLLPGIYELHLLFAETVWGRGNRLQNGERSRMFHLNINGTRRLSFFDILAEAGSADVPADRFFTDVSPAQDGYLHLEFISAGDLALLNGIEIFPGLPGKLRPIRILCGGRSFRDRSGRLWDADQYFLGGRPLTKPTLVTGTPDPELYRNERWGHFSYSIPVAAEGRYTLTLKFAETEFGPDNSGGGGEGSRLFDVYCNGVALLRNFDIYKEADGEDRSVDKVFNGLKPNAQSHLQVSFVPVKQYATVRAIEVVDERR